MDIQTYIYLFMGFPGDSVVKNLLAVQELQKDKGSIPGSGRFLEGDMATHSSILAWGIPWTENLAGYSQLDLKGSEMTEAT